LPRAEEVIKQRGADSQRGPDMKVLIKTAWGSDESTKACFAFLHANAFAGAGHEVRIFLLGEAVNLMKDALIRSVTPVGWPPLSEILHKTIEHEIPISV
jgi:predicted peroxiredoxin